MRLINDYLEKSMHTYRRQLATGLIMVYLSAILYITCLCRTPSILAKAAPYPFWAYSVALTGDLESGLEIIENIILFFPLGYLIKQVGLAKKYGIVIGLVTSVSIELLQLTFHLGMFEFDDILHNTLGAIIGIIVYDQIRTNDIKKFCLSGIVVVGAFVYCMAIQEQKVEVPAIQFFFEIESYSAIDNIIILEGSCFIYNKPDEEYRLFLKSEENTIQLCTSGHLPSDTMEGYFKCEEDYTRTAFYATAEFDTSRTYELLIQWENQVVSSTGIYIKNGEVVYSTIEAPIYSGTLLVAEPIYDCYVYQYNGVLYWLCGPGFSFEDDGSTYIQYHLYTTQTDRLPAERIANNWLWDNRGFNFEDYEIEPCGIYRVAKCSIPTSYSVTAICTGYCKEGEWIWKDYFRPIVYEITESPNGRKEK